MTRVILGVVGLLLLSAPASAVDPHEILKDPALEARARVVGKDLRCLVCQNQSIDDSDADLARDLRVLVRERIVAGDSNEEVIDYVVSRYGDFVLLNPPFKPLTYALWIGPGIVLIGGFVLVFFVFRNRRASTAGVAAAPLDEKEQTRLREILDEDPK